MVTDRTYGASRQEQDPDYISRSPSMGESLLEACPRKNGHFLVSRLNTCPGHHWRDFVPAAQPADHRVAFLLAALGGLGTTVGYHRLLAHHTLKVNKAFEHLLIFLGRLQRLGTSGQLGGLPPASPLTNRYA